MQVQKSAYLYQYNPNNEMVRIVFAESDYIKIIILEKEECNGLKPDIHGNLSEEKKVDIELLIKQIKDDKKDNKAVNDSGRNRSKSKSVKHSSESKSGGFQKS